jgi:hypothetical protein
MSVHQETDEAKKYMSEVESVHCGMTAEVTYATINNDVAETARLDNDHDSKVVCVPLHLALASFFSPPPSPHFTSVPLLCVGVAIRLNLKPSPTLKVLFEEFWAEAKLVKNVLLSKSGKELYNLRKKLFDIADKQ